MDRVRRLWVGLAAVIAARLVAYALIPLCSEDAYITFHAALDPAWRIAATSPVWLFLVSGSQHPDMMARFWSLLADCGAVWAAWRVLCPTVRPTKLTGPGVNKPDPWLPMGSPGYWAFLALWVSPFFTGSAVSGLETHVVAAAMLVARVHPAGYAVAAMLRPDAAVLALCASGRKWVWALAGASVLALVALCTTGHVIPQTITSKLLTYGVHPGSWEWLHPQGFGWMTLALPLAFFSKARRYVVAAAAFLLAHVAIGTVAHWWYAVPPLAMLGFAACERIRRPWHLWAALAVIAAFAYPQGKVLWARTQQEAQLWRTGQEFATHHPQGSILLEPAGMIPYLNPQLTVYDDVGLLDPWMAARRARGRGWRTDALEHYRPRWLIVRLREYIFPGTWQIGQAYYGPGDSVLPDYGAVWAPGVTMVRPGIGKTKMVSSNLVILARR